MVNEEWMERKIIQLQTDHSNGQWTEIREQQIKYLKTLITSKAFANNTSDSITEELILIFHRF
jgi:hypothetical protein